MDQPSESVKTVTSMEARKNFGKMLEEVHYRGDMFVIGRKGKPMAAIVPLSVLEEWQKHSDPAKAEHDTNKGNRRQLKKRRS
jgi:prevent-host-death family protein